MTSYALKVSVALLTLSHFTNAIGGEVNTGYFGNVAIKGYDPVAYFTQHKAIKGAEDISYTWLGAEWQFSTKSHRALFSEDPIKYAPQYGGHCADGIAYGDLTTNIDPEAWRIIEGRLYLNYDQGAAAEIEELEGQLEKSVKNWPGIRTRLVSNGGLE